LVALFFACLYARVRMGALFRRSVRVCPPPDRQVDHRACGMEFMVDEKIRE